MRCPLIVHCVDMWTCAVSRLARPIKHPYEASLGRDNLCSAGAGADSGTSVIKQSPEIKCRNYSKAPKRILPFDVAHMKRSEVLRTELRLVVQRVQWCGYC